MEAAQRAGLEGRVRAPDPPHHRVHRGQDDASVCEITDMLNHRTLQRTQRYIQGAEGRRRAEQDLREALVEVARVRPSTDERPGRQKSPGRFIF